MRWIVVGAAAAGAVVLAERVAIGRMRKIGDPGIDALLDLPADVIRRDLPSHDGGTIHLLERGEGRPIVLLHGITLQASIWAPQFHLLAGDHRVIALDVRGHGRSTAGTEGFGLGVLASDLKTVLEELDLRDAIVVGHSMGGMAVMKFCADHPELLRERVAGLAMVATAAEPPVPRVIVGLTRRMIGVQVQRLEGGRRVAHYRWGENDLSWMLVRLAFGKAPSSKAVEQMRDAMASVGPESFQPSMAGILVHDALESLAAHDTPAVVVVGTRDLLTPVSHARRIAEIMPHAELHILRDAGHQLMQERPEELNEILLDLEATIRRNAPAASS